MKRLLSYLIMGTAALCLAGCGPKLVNVHGKVTYNGQPPGEAGMYIIFVSTADDAIEVMASISPEGAYQANGVVAGQNNIIIYYKDPLRTTREYVSKSKYRNLPIKYADITKPIFSFEAKEGGVFDADLTGPVLKE